MVCHGKSFTLSNERKKILPPSAVERPFGPICSLALDESAHLFFRLFDDIDDVTLNIKKIKEIGSYPRKLWPFESTPGHPSRIP